MRRLGLHPAARAELAEAAAWYDDRQSGLGDDFLDAIERTLKVIARSPSRWPRIVGISEAVRRIQVHDFPYVVIYRVGEQEVVIVAVAHTKRRPGYWSRRLRKR